MKTNQKQKNTVSIKIFDWLYLPIFKNKKRYKIGELPEGNVDIKIDQKFLDDFLENAEQGKKWCEESAMHWAEILTFSFCKMVVTFDLGILGFLSYMKEEFSNQTIFFLSVSFAIVSLLILTVFMRGVIVKNINSLAERKRILSYTAVLSPTKIKYAGDATKVVELFKKQGDSLKESLESLEEHKRLWMPWHKIGIYLFYFSVLSTLLGIVL